MKSKRRGVLDATAITAVGIAILVGLGIWQLDRRVWKESLIASLSEKLNAAAIELPPREQWDRLSQQADEFRRVKFPGEILNDKEALVYTSGSSLRPDVKEQGFWVFAPVRLPGGSIVVVNRGFVPNDKKDLASRPQGALSGIVDIVGVMRWPESRGIFTPADDAKGNVWYLRDPQAMAKAKEWGATAAFYIDQEEPPPPGGLPRVGKLAVALPNNHLQYALTWFALATALAGVYLTWLIGRLRRPR